MTTETEPHPAAVGQYNVIRSLSKQIFGLEWEVLDEYQVEEILSFRDAANLIEALHQVKPFANVGNKEQTELNRQRLRAVMNGPLPQQPPPRQPDPPVDKLLEDEPIPVPELPPTVFIDPLENARAPEEKPLTRLDTQAKPINHGTYAGYQTHKRRNEMPCDACKAGYRAKQREYTAASNAKRRRNAAQPRQSRNQPTELLTAASSNGFWEELRPQMLSVLFARIPASTGEPFPKADQEAWLSAARKFFEVLWPEETA